MSKSIDLISPKDTNAGILIFSSAVVAGMYRNIVNTLYRQHLVNTHFSPLRALTT